MRKHNILRIITLLMSIILLCSPLSLFTGCSHAEKVIQLTPGRLAAGRGFAYAIDNDGNLWGWAQSCYYLGIDEGFYMEKPLHLMQGTRFTYVDAGQYTSYAIDEAGNLWSWGSSSNNMLGYEIEKASTGEPKIVMEGVHFSSVSAGLTHIFAIDTEGKLWAWGRNGYGQFGDGTTTDSITPIQVLPEMRFSQACAGNNESYAIDTDGRLWFWGAAGVSWDDDEIQPDGTVGKNDYPTYLAPIQLMPEKRFVSVDGHSMVNTFAVDEDGILWGRGANNFFELGDFDGKESEEFIPINDNFTFTHVRGALCVYALGRKGDLWAWGDNYSGNLGDGTTEKRDVPVHVLDGTKFTWVAYDNSGVTAYALDTEGNVWTMGYNPFGNWRIPETDFDNTTPVRFYLGDAPEEESSL